MAGRAPAPFNRAALLVLIGGVLAAFAWFAADRWTLDVGEASLRAEADARAASLAHGVDEALARADLLPRLLARDADIAHLLADPTGDARRPVNLMLEAVAAEVGADVIYLLNAQGLTLAASNWADPESFVGNDYYFRPYYTEAVRQGAARYFAVGVTTRKAGLYVSATVGAPAAVRGVVVAKLSLDRLEAVFAGSGEPVLLSDRNGIVFLASDDAFRYHALAPLPAATYAAVIAEQQYGEQGLGLVEIDRTRYLVAGAAVAESGWRLDVLADRQPVRERARAAAWNAALATIAVTAILLWLDQRTRRRRAEARALHQARDELEAELNRRSADLKRTQDELIHAARMAALGQMSAVIAHEVNQPLAAMRAYVASARLLLDRGRPEAVRDTIGEIDGLAVRLAEITGKLKTFARKGDVRRGPVALGRVIEAARALLAPRLDRDAVVFSWSVPTDAWVLAEENRLIQVLVNLIGNALDAMAGRPLSRLSVVATPAGDDWRIDVADNGPGVTEADRARLFDPFFTTKPAGVGLGLGLSISYGIAAEFGGSLTARNGADGGAVFTLTLPAAATRKGDDIV